MRSTLRLLATVQRNGVQYLEPGAPTGLTGLQTHRSPRSRLLYLYSKTLDELKRFPEHSVYRQSAEALTKHRLSIIESVKPAGLNEWQSRVQSVVEDHPSVFRKVPVSSETGSSEYNIVWKSHVVIDGENADEVETPVVGDEWALNEEQAARMREKEAAKNEEMKQKLDPQMAEFLTQFKKGIDEGEGALQGGKEEVGNLYEARKKALMTGFDAAMEGSAVDPELSKIELEPALSAEQISEIETKINAGLIEEVIEVAEAEQRLAAVMFENKVWEDLEEKPVEGQWTYHERDRHTSGSNASQ